MCTDPTPAMGRNSLLYRHARQSVLFHNDPSVARLQRSLRLGYAQALALREAMRGDILEHPAPDGPWRLIEGAHEGPDPLLHEKLAQAARWLHEASSMVVLAGPGMGIDSGLPDWQGGSGLWPAPAGSARAPWRWEDITTLQAFLRHPQQAWGFYGHCLNLCRAAAPHSGFSRLLRWSQRMPQGCLVFTSNADGQFQKAGFPTARISECQGTLHRLQCTASCSGELWPTRQLRPQVDAASGRLSGPLPCCPRCGALARPNVQMREDWRWSSQRFGRQRRLFDLWLDRNPAPLVLEIGVDRNLAAMRHFGLRLEQRGSRRVCIDLRAANPHNPHAVELALGAESALQRIDAQLTKLGAESANSG